MPLDTLISIIVLLVFGILVYTGIKKQSLKDTFEDIKELFGGDNA